MIYDIEEIRSIYKDLYEYSLDMIFVNKLNGEFLDANDIALKTLGYEREDIPHYSLSDIMDKDQFKKAYEAIIELKKTGRQSNLMEFRLNRKDGGTIYVETYGIPLYKNGKIYATLGIARNITDLRNAQNRIEKSEEKYRFLYETTPYSIILINSEGIIVDCNPTTELMFGYIKDELVGRHFKNISAIHQKYIPILIELFPKHIEGEMIDPIDIQIYHKNGKLMWVNTQASIIKLSGNLFVQVTFHDITDKKVISQKLEESEEQYRNLYQNALACLWTIRIQDTKIIRANKVSTEFSGVKSLEELIDKYYVSDFFEPDVIRDIYKKLKISGEISGLETRFKDIMGNEKTISVWAKIYFDRGIIEGAFIDITYLKIVQKALQESEERYRILFENSPYAIGLINKEGIIIHANSNNEKLSGYKREEFVGKKFTEYSVFSQEDTNVIIDSFKKLLKGEIPEPQELLLHKKDGSKTWVLMQASILKIDNETVFQIITQDISTQKEASEKLKESEEKYKILFETSPHAVGLMNSKGVVVQVNSNVEKIFGYTKEEILGKSFGKFRLFSEEHNKLVFDSFNKLIKGEIPESQELQLHRKDGTVIWVSMQASIVRLSNETLFQIITQDISEQKEASEKLKESEEKYRTLIENIPQRIFLKDKNSVYISCNNNYAMDLKIKAEEIIGKTDYDFYPKELADKYRVDDKRIISTGEAEEMDEFDILDGKERYVRTIKTPIRDNSGNITGLIGIFWDITERKEAEEKLRESEQKYRHLFDKSPNMIILLDSNGRVLDANTPFLNIFNYKEEELIGKNYQEFKYISLNNLPIYIEKFKNIFIDGVIEPFELHVEIKDGIFRWMNIQGSLIDIEGKKILQAIFQDINERKEAELKLKESEERYRIITENANDLISVINEKFRFEYINEEVHKRVTGYSKEDLIGKSPLNNIHPDDINKTVKTWRDAVISGEGTTEFRYKKKDGTWIWLDMRGKKFIDTNGEPKGIIISRDITQHKIAEQKLKESEQKYRYLFENSPYSIGLLDLEGTIIEGNEATNKFLSMRTKDEIIGKNIREIFSSTEQERSLLPQITDYFKKVIKDEIREPLEIPITRSIGGVIWVSFYGSLIKIGDETFLQFIGQDITDRKRAEQNLKKSEEQFRRLFENSPNAIVLNNEDGIIVDCNSATERIFGVNKNQLIGVNYMATQGKSASHTFKKRYGDLLEDKELKPTEFQLIRRDGTPVWINYQSSVIKLGDETVIQSILQDITKRKLAEQNLTKSEEKYRLLFEKSPNAIILSNSKGTILDFNQVTENLLGYKRDEIIGTNYAKITSPSHIALMKKRYKNHLKGMPLNPIEFEAEKRDGSKIWVNFQNEIIKFEEEDINISIIQDITKRKEAELLINEELIKLKELEQIRKDLISRVSHELKTPLIPVISGTELLTTIYKDQIGEDALEIIDMIDKGGARLKELVEKLINVSRIDYNKFDVRKETFNLSEIIKRSANSMKFLMEQRKLKLKCEIPEKLFLEMDELRIEEVIMNLLSNAIKNTPPHGEINLSLRKEDNWAIITVSDTGVGLTEKEKEILFTRFGKIERYEKGLEDIDVKGSGLGLYICKEIIQLHEGQIWAESEGRNKGSSFNVKLPIK